MWPQNVATSRWTSPSSTGTDAAAAAVLSFAAATAAAAADADAAVVDGGGAKTRWAAGRRISAGGGRGWWVEGSQSTRVRRERPVCVVVLGWMGGWVVNRRVFVFWGGRMGKGGRAHYFFRKDMRHT